MHTFHLGFCDPVQESVFECVMDDRQAKSLKMGVRRVVRRTVDNVRYYRLCAWCGDQIKDLDGPDAAADPDSVVV